MTRTVTRDGAALARREALAAGALVVLFPWLAHAQQAGGGEGPPGPAVTAEELKGSLKSDPNLDSWIRVDGDGRVTVLTGKAELGQGIKTAVLQVAADELDVAPDAITLVTADTARTANEGVTAGSHSMQDSATAIRNAAANVRLLLVAAAATQWGLTAETLTTDSGAVHAPDGRVLGYGPLAAGLSLHVRAQPGVALKSGSARRFIGQSVKRVDIPAKLTGGAAYVQDMRMDGMVHARVLRGPAQGTRLRDLDAAAIERMPGVVGVVRQGRFAAVVATREWTAITALRRAQAGGWESVPAATDRLRTAHASMAAGDAVQDVLQRLPPQDITVLEVSGPVSPSARTLSARYTRPYLIHGSIGPSCAVALFQDGALTVWSHTQGAYPLQGALADLLGMAPRQVRVIHVEGSGCYGHNAADDVAADAAMVARAMPGRPIRMQWMREQEHGWEPMGPAMVTELSGAVDAQGQIVSWHHAVWSNAHNGRPVTGGGLLAGAELDPPLPAPVPKAIPMPEGGGDRNSNPLYALPDMHVVYHFLPDAPQRVSALRGLGAHMNVFSIESFVDELAAAASVDPVEFRLRHMQDPRARDVIAMAAERGGWTARTREGAAPGVLRGSGFAFARYKNLGAYCALAVDIDIRRETGALRVRRVTAAVDSGEAVNPDGIRNQIEGAIVQSLSWTTQEAVGLRDARRSSYDWSTYPILRFADAPERLDVHIIDRPGQPFLGTGEAGQGPMAAAIANAIADATGTRLRAMPLDAASIRAAVGV